ncbi:MAG TPA: nitrile hydratase subunit beta [Caulobacteraceae bacterium]|nr:nitrile hydratase subunit beta [Caulobacteraceae bacterium]
MNGVHDMGGMDGLGPLAPEADEPVFHAEWERRAFAMAMTSPTRGGRRTMERIPGPEYLRMSYYERWLTGLCMALIEQNVVTAEELASGRADPSQPKATNAVGPEQIRRTLTTSGSYMREAVAPPAFEAGDRVRARNLNPLGHTRLPRYVRGREGRIERHHGTQIYPDVAGEAHPLYTVRFSARELWGPDASERDSVSLDLWEPYLERA